MVSVSSLFTRCRVWRLRDSRGTAEPIPNAVNDLLEGVDRSLVDRGDQRHLARTGHTPTARIVVIEGRIHRRLRGSGIRANAASGLVPDSLFTSAHSGQVSQNRVSGR